MPSGATGNAPTSAMKATAFETCGYYPRGTTVPSLPREYFLDPGTYLKHEACDYPDVAPLVDDQQPRSSHTYSKNVYDPFKDRFCYLAGSYYPSAQTSSARAVCFSFATGQWSRIANVPQVSRGASGVDAFGHFWSVPNGTGKLDEYAPATNTWKRHANSFPKDGYPITYLTGDVDRTRHDFYVLAYQGQMFRFDLDAPDAPLQWLQPSAGAPSFSGSGGLVYADGLDRLAAWSGGQTVYFFAPATNTWTPYTGTGDNPGAAEGNGTFGRWRYSPKRKVFVLVNSSVQNVYLYKPPASP
jgi:hypothetical protein